MSYEVVDSIRDEVPVAVACGVLGVSKSAYYEHCKRAKEGPSERDRENVYIDHAIKTAFDEFKGTYGRPRIQKHLRQKGVHIGANRLKRKMVEMGLLAKPRRRFRKTTESEHDNPIAPNLLKQDFSAVAPNQVLCSDLTYVRTWQGWLYVCVIIDLYSRKVVGWAVAEHMRDDLVTRAFDMAVGLRNVQPGLIFIATVGANTLRKPCDADSGATG